LRGGGASRYASGVRAVLPVLFLCAAAAAHARSPVRVLLHATPSARDAGIVMADHDGYFASAGIEAKFLLREDPGLSAPHALAAGRADFASLPLAGALSAVAKDRRPLVGIAQFSTHSTLALFTRADGAVDSPRDLAGRRISATRAALPAARALLTRYAVSAELLPASPTYALFSEGAVDALVAPEAEAFFALTHGGVPAASLRVRPLASFGLDWPEDGLYATRALLASDPELCRAFAAAVLAGWRAAASDPARAAAVLAGRAPARGLRARLETELPALLSTLALSGADLGLLRGDDVANILSALSASLPPSEPFHANCLP
jgi:NitT/TauT family transport system substrate-binding protein